MTENQTELVQFLRTSVASVTGRRLTTGFKFGVELELEGINLGHDDGEITGWVSHVDTSVPRGLEWVSVKPLEFKETLANIDGLWKFFEKNKTAISNSYRTSTHVHLNFSDKKVADVYNMFLLFTIFEEVLTTYCGATRKGNLFCLSVRDAEGILDQMDQAFEERSFRGFGEATRYGALNLNALNKFGSLEVRTMRGVTTKEELIEWLDILNRLYTYACTTNSPPSSLLESLSFLGPKGFMESVFGETITAVLTKDYTEMQLHSSLYEGLRLIQMQAYMLGEAWEEAKKADTILPSSKFSKSNPYATDPEQWGANPGGPAVAIDWNVDMNGAMARVRQEREAMARIAVRPAREVELEPRAPRARAVGQRPRFDADIDEDM